MWPREMRPRSVWISIALAIGLAGCGASAVTADRLERAMAPTFGHLVPLQIARVGLAPLGADLKVVASCYRLAGGSAGAGDWVCTLVWSGPNRTTLRDIYDVAVTPDGCYTAAVDAAETQLGGPSVKTTDGRNVRNLLYAFEGCFDTRR